MSEKRRLTFKNPPVESARPAAPHPRVRIVSHARPAKLPAKLPAKPTVTSVPPRKRRRGLSLDAVIGIFVGIVALVVLVVIGYWYKQKQIEARYEAVALQKERTRAYAAYERIAPFITQTGKLLEQADRHIAGAKDAVAFVTGIPYETHVSPRPRPAAAARPAAERQAAASPTSPTSKPQDGISTLGSETSGGRESPEGILTREELDRRRARSAAAAAAPPPPDPSAQAEETAPTEATDSSAPTSPTSPASPAPAEIVTVARAMVENRDQVAGRIVEMVDLQVQADEKRSEAAQALDSATAAVAAAAIEDSILKVEHLVALAGAAVEKLGADALRCETLRADEVAARAARAAEKKRLREAEELRKLIANEKRRAVELHANTRERSPRYEFASSLAELEQALESFKTKEGRADLTLHVERFRRMARQKEQLIKNLNETPFRWGWGTTVAASKDVLGADEVGVNITGTLVPWADVSVPQMLKFIDHYGRAPGRRLRDRAEDTLTSAIMLTELGLRDEACERVRDALQDAEYLEDDARRLVPSCF